MTTPAGDGPQRRSGHRLPQTARKSIVVVHVVVSVSWLALMLCLLTLGMTALATNNADTLRTAYRAMGMLGNVLIIPLSLLTLVSGVMLALATPWGLFRAVGVGVLVLPDLLRSGGRRDIGADGPEVTGPALLGQLPVDEELGGGHLMAGGVGGSAECRSDRSDARRDGDSHQGSGQAAHRTASKSSRWCPGRGGVSLSGARRRR